MNRFVLGYRTTYDGDWTESVSGDYLPFVRDAAEMLARGWPHRQWAIFIERLPECWWSGKPRYLFGASDAQLYGRKYGAPMPLDTACGALVQTLDREALH